MKLPPVPVSPPWSKSSKRLITSILIVLTLLLIYGIRGLLIYVLMAMIVAYIVHPVVNLIQRSLGLPRLAAIAVVYIGIIAGLISVPLRTIPQLIAQFNAFISNVPRYARQLEKLLQEPITIGDNVFTLTELPLLEETVGALTVNLVNIAQSVGTRSFSLFGSLASATLSTVVWLLVVLFLSFYMVKDHALLFDAVLRFVPEAYQADIYRLGSEISATWNAFLRGQLILFAGMGTVVFVLASLIGLPNALLLGLTSGLAEFIPQIGATLAMIPALLVAFFQSEASWLGRQMSPFWFMLLIMGLYILLQQIENYFVVPRVIGRQLNLHPLLVFVAALVGASAAGILGILVAAPLLATGRLIFHYIYCKLTDQPPFPSPPFSKTQQPYSKPEQKQPYHLIFRPARQKDEGAVRAISSQIWDGEDYVSDCFADWVSDPYGQFTVVYAGDQLVAFNKLTRLRLDEWWMEGLRVSPQHRNRGLARQLHSYTLSLVDQIGGGQLRFATAASNTTIHKIALESGFHLVSEHLLAEADVKKTSESLPFRRLESDELEAVRSWLSRSARYAAVGGLAVDDWVWPELKPRLETWLREGRLFWWTGSEGEERGLVILNCSRLDVIWLNYVDVPEDDLTAVAVALPLLAGNLGGQMLKGMPPAGENMRAALSKAGWRVDELEMRVYERTVNSGAMLPLESTAHMPAGGKQ